MIDHDRNVTSVVVGPITAVSFHDNTASRPTPSSLADAAPTTLLQGTAAVPTAQTWAAIWKKVCREKRARLFVIVQILRDVTISKKKKNTFNNHVQIMSDCRGFDARRDEKQSQI